MQSIATEFALIDYAADISQRIKVMCCRSASMIWKFRQIPRKSEKDLHDTNFQNLFL